MKLCIPDMSCSHCVMAIEKAVLAAEPAAVVACDLEKRIVEISSLRQPDNILRVIRDAGYEPTTLVSN
ncbi:heavy-metal-associated domain-containing protein [uncultured Roseibium sp.]|uniref:heavy-metal-associated domain-containing protein n=1 Tax=Roseibium sp. TaxID=1936156 RepID=UPI002602B129|nr:heavy-metal-associated domain-containing protein [uncultured Roseibium sp.]